ncbi:MAG: TerB family tellurite resistance protein [Pirellulales bacterium]|nr:TerB family tellurite resistance protein [Pirellulales bacterium]
MNLTRTRERGNFYCPTCRNSQTFRLRARRPWLTLYFIPTVPVGGAELFVQCDQCRQSWDPSVLAMDQESHELALEEQFREQAVRAALLIVLADGTISENEINALGRIASHLLQRPVDREELGQLCSIAEQNKITAINYVTTVSVHWSQTQRIQALQAMFLAATADGDMGEEQVDTLAQMQKLLLLSDEEYQSAIEEALTWETV